MNHLWDLKSLGSDAAPVRLRPRAPNDFKGLSDKVDNPFSLFLIFCSICSNEKAGVCRYWKARFIEPRAFYARLRSVFDEAVAFVSRMSVEKAGLLFLKDGKAAQPDPDRLDACGTHAGQRRGHCRAVRNSRRPCSRPVKSGGSESPGGGVMRVSFSTDCLTTRSGRL